MFSSSGSEVGEAVAGVAGEDRDGWSSAARSARMLELLEARERLEAEVLRCAGEWDAAGAWGDDGALNPQSWLVQHARVTRADAVRLVRAARLARRHERTGKALAAGDVSAAHVDLIARAVRHREDVYEDRGEALLDAAMALPPETFRRAAQCWRSLADDAAADSDAHEAFEARRFHCSPTFGGRVVLDGELDADAGATVAAALRAYDEGPGATAPDGRRLTLAQRNADALTQICAHALDAKGAGRPVRGVDVIIDLETLSGAPPTDLATARCEIEGVGPVARSVALRMACDAAVGRVLMRGRSEVLDLGRRTRLVSAAQRRALVARDGGCVFPGCDRPHWWCDGHHLVDWVDGGRTDLADLALLCRRHHVACHEGGWSLVRGPDGTIEAVPP